jgi:trk system potassium uptake protein TrkA
MKYIVIGLGNFGSSLAEQLTIMGHEVIGVDNQISKIESLKDKITHTVCLNSKDISAVQSLPLSNTDATIVCIGEDEGANIMTTAILKKLNVKHIISRSLSPLHETIIEAMGVTEIVNPEQETAKRLAKKLTNIGLLDYFAITKEHSIFEIMVPKQMIGKTIEEIGFNKNYEVIVLTTLKFVEEKNLIGQIKKITKVQGIANAKTVLKEGEIMVLYGSNHNINNFLHKYKVE